MGTEATRTLANEVRLACQLVSRAVRFETRDTLAPHLLAILGRLREAAATPGELAAAERVSAPSMSKSLDYLEEAGFVSRTPDPDDGRRRIVAVTEAGIAELRRTAGARDEFMESRLAALSPEQREVLGNAAAILREVVA